MNIKDKILADLIMKLVSHTKTGRGDFVYYKYFRYWQKKGVNIIPNHYYQPIPDISELETDVYRQKSDLSGINMNDKKQLLLLKIFLKYQKEYDAFKNIPPRIDDQVDSCFYLRNYAFDGVDALSYYCLVRMLKPKKIIEVGSGWSTKIAALASLKNMETELTCIEPYPQPILTKGFPGLKKLITEKVEKVPVEFFKKLGKNDILFIDTSHTVKIGSDVNYLILDILPILSQGVYIHIHDIFFPENYPELWVKDEYRFWNEQYLLHAFLIFNNRFEVILTNRYLSDNYLTNLKKTFPKSPFFEGVSFWIKKIK